MKNKKFRFMFGPHRKWYAPFMVYHLNVIIEAPTDKAAFKKFRDYTDEEIVSFTRM